MVQLYIGDGKGKTTAALGLALRALGWGKKVYILQFLKGGKFSSGEEKALAKHKKYLTFERLSDQVHPIFFTGKNTPDIKKLKLSTEKALVKVEKYLDRKSFDMIILDELLNAVKGKFTSLARVKKVISGAKTTELVLTGRQAPPELQALADYVSVIKKGKHPFDRKILARKGVEY